MKKDKMMERFTEAQMYNLVKIYKEYECLWDVSNPFYKNRQARDNAYKEILEKLHIPMLNIRDIPQKIKNLRTSYFQEVRKIKASLKEGGPCYQPKVVWFSLADEFLREVPKSQQEYMETASEPETTNKRIKRLCTLKTTATLDKKAKNITPQSTSTQQYAPQSKNEDDEYDSFGKYIASSLRSMPQEMSIIAKMELQNTMADVQLRALGQMSRPVLPAEYDPGPSTSSGCEDLLQYPLEYFTEEPELTLKVEIEED